MQIEQGDSVSQRLARALMRGFETVGAQPALIILPIAFDLFYWLGPRLTLESLVKPLLSTLNDPNFIGSLGSDPSGTSQNMIATYQEAITEVGKAFNAFAARPLFPLGMPSLYSFFHDGATPIPASVAAPNDLGQVMVVALVSTVISLVAMAFYMGIIANQVSTGHLNIPLLMAKLPRYALSLAGLVVFVVGVAIAGAFVLSFGAGILMIFGLDAALLLVQLVGVVFSLWLATITCFTMFTVFLCDCTLLQAFRQTLRVLRVHLRSLMLLGLIVLVIIFLLSQLWERPAGDTWMPLISIIAQAVVSTALVVSAFSFYRDCYQRTPTISIKPTP